MKPWDKEQWCIASVTPRFVACLEDVLDVYEEPYDPLRPVVCVDEYPLALSAPSRPELPMHPGQPARQDYEYQRRGSCSLFGAFQPRAGWRMVQVHERRTAQDFAHFLQTLVDDHFPDAQVIRLVLDNLNTHTLAALYATFPPAEARRIARKLAFHYTPPHGSWLNMIEIEWSVLAHQCFKHRRLPDSPTVQHEVDAWAARRNAAHATVHWCFTTPDARRAVRYPLPLEAAPAADPAAPAPAPPHEGGQQVA